MYQNGQYKNELRLGKILKAVINIQSVQGDMVFPYLQGDSEIYCNFLVLLRAFNLNLYNKAVLALGAGENAPRPKKNEIKNEISSISNLLDQ